jgi:hypothetical protein
MRSFLVISCSAIPKRCSRDRRDRSPARRPRRRFAGTSADLRRWLAPRPGARAARRAYEVHDARVGAYLLAAGANQGEPADAPILQLLADRCPECGVPSASKMDAVLGPGRDEARQRNMASICGQESGKPLLSTVPLRPDTRRPNIHQVQVRAGWKLGAVMTRDSVVGAGANDYRRASRNSLQLGGQS